MKPIPEEVRNDLRKKINSIKSAKEKNDKFSFYQFRDNCRNKIVELLVDDYNIHILKEFYKEYKEIVMN